MQMLYPTSLTLWWTMPKIEQVLQAMVTIVLLWLVTALAMVVLTDNSIL